MHVTTKDTVGTDADAKALNVPIGTHILTSVIEGDGATELASVKAKLSAKVLSVQRTDSGGIQVQTAALVSEPTPAPAPTPVPVVVPPTPQEQAESYFVEKGMTPESAKAQVARFGTTRVLAMRDKELDDQLAALVAKEDAGK
jgi:hypothetical protein